MTARNKRGGRDVPINLRASGVLLFLGAQRLWASGEENGLPVPKRARNLVRNCARQNSFLGREILRKFKMGLWFTAPKNFTQLLSPKNSTPVFERFSWFCPPAHSSWSCTDCSPSSWVETKRPGVQQGYNTTSNETKKNVLGRKMPQGLVLVKWLLTRESRGEIWESSESSKYMSRQFLSTGAALTTSNFKTNVAFLSFKALFLSSLLFLSRNTSS